jgi:hypothetical protein
MVVVLEAVRGVSRFRRYPKRRHRHFAGQWKTDFNSHSFADRGAAGAALIYLGKHGSLGGKHGSLKILVNEAETPVGDSMEFLSGIQWNFW